jgi:hypothetical protein
MTKYLERKYQNNELKSCSKDDIDSLNQNSTSNQKNSNYFMRFDEFNEFSNKNKPLKIKEVFAKCLMKIQGLSQDKCLSIVDVYPTLTA